MITKTVTENVGDAYHTTEYTFNNVQELMTFESGQGGGGDPLQDSGAIQIGSICKVVGDRCIHGLKYGTLVLILNKFDSVGNWLVRPLDRSYPDCCVPVSYIELVTNDVVDMF